MHRHPIYRHRSTTTNLKYLKPLLRAYALGYVSTTAPRLLNLLLSCCYRRSGKGQDILISLRRIFTGPLQINRFPAFCGLLVGGSTLLQTPLRVILGHLGTIAKRRGWGFSSYDRARLARFLAAWLAAWFSLQMLNSNQAPRTEEEDVNPRKEAIAKDISTRGEILDVGPGQRPRKEPFVRGGKTLDLTLFAIVRALDVVAGELWSRYKLRRYAISRWTQIESSISHMTDAGVFAVSAGAVMWAWIYLPGRLPRAYNRWIGEAAQVDHRLVETLRRVRWGEFVYGKDTGQAPLLQSMCRDYGWPLQWGDPAKTVPIPCEIVHMGTGPSCEKHAVVRFGRAFKFAFAMYLPIQLLVRMRSPSVRALQQAVTDAARSSAFLGAFVSIFYYSICLSRTRLGPKLISYEKVTAMMWDQGLCVGAGCAMCGWSILIEAERRRQEVALFVAPRAAATLLPRRYDEKYRWRESLAFAISTAVVFTYAQENPQRVRGMLGKLLDRVLNHN